MFIYEKYHHVMLTVMIVIFLLIVMNPHHPETQMHGTLDTHL